MDFLKILLVAWLLICTFSWFTTGAFFFFHPQTVLSSLVTERDVKTILKFKGKTLTYNEAYQALLARNPDLLDWEIERLLLNEKENF